MERLAPQDPDDRAVWLALANAEQDAGHGDAAMAALTHLRELFPTDIFLQRNAAHVYLAFGHIEEGVALLRAIKLEDDATQRALARWSIALGRYSDAVVPLRALLKRYPDSAEYSRELGATSLLCGGTEEAVAATKAAWMLHPDDLSAQQYATSLYLAGHTREAEDMLMLAIRLFPAESALKNILALVYRDTDRMEQAADLTAQLALQRPEAAELLSLAGARYLAAKDVTKAEDIAGQLNDRSATDEISFFAALRLYQQLGLTADAGSMLTRYWGPTTQAPVSRTVLLLEIVRNAMDDNQPSEALVALQELIKENPEYKPAYLLWGKLYEQQGLWDDAVRYYRETRTQWPKDADLTLALARAARQSGDFSLAVDSYRAALTLTSSADPWLELGEIYRRLHDLAQARACWTHAAQLPDGCWRARRQLLGLDGDTQAPEKKKDELNGLLQALLAERQARAARWRAELATCDLTSSDEEMNTLLLLSPDLVDPAPLQQLLAAPTPTTGP